MVGSGIGFGVGLVSLEVGLSVMTGGYVWVSSEAT